MTQRQRAVTAKQRTERDAPAKDLDAKVRELRRRQKLAIQSMDFDLAEAIEKQIHGARGVEIDQVVQDACVKIQNEADKVLKDIEERLKVVEQEKIKNEGKIRIRINTQFDSIQSGHITALIEMEQNYAAVRLRETERTIPEQEKLLLQAKHAGAALEFDKARSFRDAAQLVGETDLQARLARLDEEFEKGRQGLLKRQREDVIFLSKRLDEELHSASELAGHETVQILDTRAPRLTAVLERAVRDLTADVPDGEVETHAGKLERTLAEFLVASNCPVPVAVGNSVRTRPQKASGRTK
jgi:hypothetical protein